VNRIHFKSPDNKEEFDKYDLFRWKILRQPIGKSVQSLKDEHENSSFHLIGLIDKKIVACGRLHLNSPDEAQIRYMAVDNYHRGKGIGKQVVEELESYAKLKKVDSIILNARDHAIRFYEKSGYEVVGPYKGSDTGIPHSKMIKKI
jgi:predicted GNAT family N-acyltransferase|tara:strand:- start:61 stop:498 length:438 start_codon:yes stop_codon:yes gene_type:complete